MKHLFLTSQVRSVVKSIAEKITESQKKRMVFIDTPVRDRVHQDLSWHTANKDALVSGGFKFDLYDISGKSEAEILRDLRAFETLYIEGGNPFYFLKEAGKCNFLSYVRKRVEEGMIYISTSAGSIVAGPDAGPGERKGKSPADFQLADTKALGLVDFVIMPHWGDQKKEKAYLEEKVKNIYRLHSWPYILLADNQYVEVKDGWYKIMTVTEN